MLLLKWPIYSWSFLTFSDIAKPWLIYFVDLPNFANCERLPDGNQRQWSFNQQTYGTLKQQQWSTNISQVARDDLGGFLSCEKTACACYD
jgi:hypothetical protein